MKLLDCGHAESPHSSFTSGYGIDTEGKKHCYDCCLKNDKDSMRETGKCFAYHSQKNGKPNIINWPGGVISDKVSILKMMCDNFGGERTYLRFKFEGEIWSGFSLGAGTYLRAKRTKLKSLYE